MFVSELRTGSLVVDIDGNRLDAKFLRETGAIDDSFTIIKGASALRVASFTMSKGSVVAEWKSVAGHTYQLQATPTLENAQWSSVGAPLTATSSTTFWTNSLPVDAPRGFYRIVEN